MAVRSALPWPLRWLVLALMLGFSGALALWAFEFGRDIAGLDRNAREELQQLRHDSAALRAELADARAVNVTAASQLTTERAMAEQLRVQIRQLEADNQSLRNDLGFFERLIPASGGDSLAIRGLQAERLSATQWRWQVLMIQAARRAPEFRGVLEITFTGTLAGKPWSSRQSPNPQSVVVKGYLRQEGVIDLPAQVEVKSVTAKVLQGASVRSVQTLEL
ncbi:DUF6776 family protein [Hydrogenophaga sp.]|uniref:DUF6776 family protein n=1 Tax=Hydrogenophaga sp. TaxID=1904254 RepID=UPI00345B6B4F